MERHQSARGRGRPVKICTGASPAVVDLYAKQWQQLKDELDEYKEPKKQCKEDAEAAGVNWSALMLAMRLAELSDGKRSAFIRDFNSYVDLLGITWTGDIEGGNDLPNNVHTMSANG